MAPETPYFDSLPLKKEGPRGNAWGLYGPTDELGMLNRLTPENTLLATKEIVHGVRVCTDWALDQPKFPGFGRAKFDHAIIHKKPRTVNDDEVKLNTQSSSQWDGFRHFGYQDHKVYFNGCKQTEIHNSSKIGTQVWVENGGIVGRGVLLDYKAWLEFKGRQSALLETTSIPVSELEEIATHQGVTFQPGDILFIHSGFVKAVEALNGEDAFNYATNQPPKAIGVESCELMLRWIWEKEFSAVAGDMLAFEALPFQSQDFWLHEWLLAGWGMPIGELFDLEKLAEECKRLKKWSFFFSSVPLKVPGGVASPPCGVAIL